METMEKQLPVEVDVVLTEEKKINGEVIRPGTVMGRIVLKAPFSFVDIDQALHFRQLRLTR